jgi:hypothetical protein
MVDIGVAIAWIVISSLSVVALSAYARAAATCEPETEFAGLAIDGGSGLLDVYAIGVHSLASTAHR